MSEVIYENVSKYASTTYNDFSGVIKIDGHDVHSLYELCKDYDIDTNNMFILGLQIQESTTIGIGRRDKISCTIFYVEKDKYGNTADEIRKSLIAENEPSIKKISTYINIAQIGKYIKRFSFVAMNEIVRDLPFSINE